MVALAAHPELKATGRGSHEQPPVIVLNMFHTGLGIAHQLWRTGVRVVGLSADPHIFGNFTRACEVRPAPNSQDNPEQLLEFLLHIAAELEGAIVFPTRDADILFLDRFRADLEPVYKLAIPPRQVLFRTINKSALAEAAVAANILTPQTTVVSTKAQLNRAMHAIGLPCVVKPTCSIHWRQDNNWTRLGARKAFRADTPEELRRLYDRVSLVHSEILLQEWIPGEDNQLAIWGGYVSDHGFPMAYFTARKIVQSPSGFGTGCVVETDCLPELHGMSLTLCRALHYCGIAEIEYKLDPRDGHFKLIEMNPRHWDWHELGQACRVNLTWAAYRSLTGLSHRPMVPTSRRAQWIAEDALLMYGASSACQGNFRWLRPILAMVGRQSFSIFSWRDPMPFVRYFLCTLLPRLARAALRKVRVLYTGARTDENRIRIIRARPSHVHSETDRGVTRG